MSSVWYGSSRSMPGVGDGAEVAVQLDLRRTPDGEVQVRDARARSRASSRAADRDRNRPSAPPEVGDHTTSGLSFRPRGGPCWRRSTSMPRSPATSISACFPSSRSGCATSSTRSWRRRSPPSWCSRAGTPPARAPSSSASPASSTRAPSAPGPGSPPSELEQRYHFLWRYQTRLPEDGHMVLFDHSWYGRVLVDRVEKWVKRKAWEGLRADQRVRALAGRRRPGAGEVLVPHLAQGAAPPPAEDGRTTARSAGRCSRRTWRRNRRYDRWLEAIEEMLARTDTPAVPWTVVEATDARWTRVKVFRDAHRAHAGRARPPAAVAGGGQPYPPGRSGARTTSARGARRRSSRGPAPWPRTRGCRSKAGSRGEPARRRRPRPRPRAARNTNSRSRPSSSACASCTSACTSGACPCSPSSRAGTPPARAAPSSASRRPSSRAGYTVSSFSAPRGEEKTHHYLWRFWRTLPAHGPPRHLRPLVLRASARRARGRVLLGRGMAAGVPRDQRVRGPPGLVRDGDPEVLDAPLARRSSCGASGPRAGSVPRPQAHARRTGATARAGTNTRPRWRTCWRARPRARALDGRRSGRQAPRAGQGR